MEILLLEFTKIANQKPVIKLKSVKKRNIKQKEKVIKQTNKQTKK